MSEEHAPAQKRPFSRDTLRPDIPPLDVERTACELKTFLDMVVQELHLAVEFEISPPSGTKAEETDVSVSFHGTDQEILLDRNAELLLALEHIGHRWLRLDPRMHDRVRFDCGDYRAGRLEDLKLSARVAAQRVRETGQPFRFNPMSARERRLIHLELNGAAGVRTVSEGAGDRRQLVVYPLGKK